MRPVRATVSIPALRHNYALAKSLAPSARAFAVVKANGYGHGLERVTEALKDADGFATLELDGAIRLRERGLAQPILMLEGFFEPAELRIFAEHGLWTSVHAEEQIDQLARAQLVRPLHVFAKMNSGMNRLGFKPAAYRAAVERLQGLPQVASVTLMTHFSSSDEPGGMDEPLARFREATQGLNLPVSVCNSAATLTPDALHGAWVRPGIMLYGATPYGDRSAASLGLKPAMRLTARIIAVQSLEPGDGVGYGLSFRAPARMRIGIVACGYADGYPRIVPTGTPVAVEGIASRTVGRVSMDMLAVDLTSIPNARVGSEVELWGDAVPIDEVARAAGTVGYELMCAVTARVPMEVID